MKEARRGVAGLIQHQRTDETARVQKKGGAAAAA